MPVSDRFAAQLTKRLRGEDPHTTPILGWLERRLAAQGSSIEEAVRRHAAASDFVQSDGAQRHHQHARDRDFGLGGLLRERQPGRCEASPEQRLCADGFPHARSLPQCDRGIIEGIHFDRDGGGRCGSGKPGSPGHPGIRAAGRRSDQRSRVPSDRRGTTGTRAQDPLPPEAPRRDLEVRPRPGDTRLCRAQYGIGRRAHIGGVVRFERDRISPALFAVYLSCGFLLATESQRRSSTGASRAGSDRSCCRAWSSSPACQPSLRTVVAVPTLLTNEADVLQQVENLEVHSSPVPGVSFSSRCCLTASTRRPRALETDDFLLGLVRGAIDTLNERHGPHPWRRSLPAVLPPPAVQSRRGRVDGMGAEARQAARVQSIAARRTDTTFIAVGGRPPIAPRDVRYVITLDADTRLPPRCGRAACRQDGASAQSSAARPRQTARGRGLRHSTAARDPGASARQSRFALSADILGAERDRSLCGGRLRRLSGPVRGGIIHRQGYL